MDGQLTEMRKGSQDTHDLAVAAKTQADRLTDVAGAAVKSAVAAEKAATAADNSAIAAANFARSADGINQKMGSTVNKLQEMVKAANQANQNSNISLEAQTRPWIGVSGEPEDVGEGDLLKGIDPPTHGITFTLRLKNYGQSPAMRIIIKSISAFKVTGDVNKSVCDPANQEVQTEPHFVQFDTVFPGSDQASAVPGVNPFYPIIIVCIAYRGRDTTLPPYSTRIAYDFLKHPNAEGKMIYDLKVRSYDAD
jgi:hypothetical protein